MHRWHRLLVCLGLLALSLAIGGPLLSQTQRLVETGRVAHDAPHHEGHQTAQTQAPSIDRHTAPKERHTTLAACDYCLFFLHMPALGVRAVTPLDRHQSSPAPPTVGEWRLVQSERYPRYRGRAPPLRSA
ncbi:DUF2946 family protein [Billgrantia sp. LNSP4103-1]|uniref:DUF2946 family protein n=1 Tax=Billgrantia sp. LNSP4103-1 TaxID=3410266 RepID=UPI00403F0A8E